MRSRWATDVIPPNVIDSTERDSNGNYNRANGPTNGLQPQGLRPEIDNSIAGLPDDLQMEQLGKQFLQDALETYNDSESGYQLSPAFEQLKNRAEGRRSDREMANFGNLSKKLFDQSTDIFNKDAASKSGRPAGVKPGQRLDQLLAAAADKALSGSDNADDDGKSLFSSALNNALEVALDQAVDIADKDQQSRGQNVPNNRNRQNTPNLPNRIDPSNLGGIETPEPSNSMFNDPYSSPSSNSSSESSIEDTAAKITDSVSKMQFDSRTLIYGAGLIGLIAVAGYFLFRLIPTADENVLKQRELQRKLENNLANPKDVVEAVDLFLLSRFGATASWWNAKHAAEEITTTQPDWREKVMSLFQVYRWSRYQADGDATVSSEQNEVVNSTLKELSQATEESLKTTTAEKKAYPSRTSNTDGEATS